MLHSYIRRDFGNLNAGDTYDQVQPLVQIDILDFDLYKDSREFYSIYHFANDNTGRIYSSKIVLHVLQLVKEEYATLEETRVLEDELRVQRTFQNQLDHLKAKLSEQEAAIVRNAAEI